MGSYGDQILNCVFCGLTGKCVPDELLNGAEPLTDCDFAAGPLCAPCLDAALDFRVRPIGAITSSSATPLSASRPDHELRYVRLTHDCEEDVEGTFAWFREARQRSHRDGGPDKGGKPMPPTSNAVSQKKADAVSQKKADASNQQTAEAGSPLTKAGEQRKDVLPDAVVPNKMISKRGPWRPKEVTVQCCDCGSYYHTAEAWKFHTETTTHSQCRDVKEKVQLFTKDADFSESPASGSKEKRRRVEESDGQKRPA